MDNKIIAPLRHLELVAKLVPVWKRNGDIRLCVDFIKLNRWSLKDNYPLPKMDHILQKVVGASRISMMDEFFGYNQILVYEEDKKKVSFTMPWGMFMYDKMFFGLMNVGANFQRDMDITFMGGREKFIIIYLDDMTIFSKSDEGHLDHLRQVFLKCRKFSLSLNPKESFFAL